MFSDVSLKGWRFKIASTLVPVVDKKKREGKLRLELQSIEKG